MLLRDLGGVLPSLEAPVRATAGFQVRGDTLVQLMEIQIAFRGSLPNGHSRNEAHRRRHQAPTNEVTLDLDLCDQPLTFKERYNAGHEIKIIVSFELGAEHALAVNGPRNARIGASPEHGLLFPESNSVSSGHPEKQRCPAFGRLLLVHKPRRAKQRARLLRVGVEHSQIQGLCSNSQAPSSMAPSMMLRTSLRFDSILLSEFRQNGGKARCIFADLINSDKPDVDHFEDRQIWVRETPTAPQVGPDTI